MSNYKLPKKIKILMERELRQYYENKKLLEDLKRNKMHVATRKFLYIEKRLEYVENVHKKLNSFEKEMYKFIFIYNYDPLYVETIKNISKSTYYNVYNKCVFLLAEEWGEI